MKFFSVVFFAVMAFIGITFASPVLEMQAFDDIHCKGSKSYAISLNDCQRFRNVASIKSYANRGVCTAYVYTSDDCSGEPILSQNIQGGCNNLDISFSGSWQFQC
ncbi:Schizosaccharomyces specific protein [Schizosaccharomyces osmophilus]|uniref:Schizosaccharomyces specific protein n=1 Tax=Schizosaccharomyces osmophilus TaxID=2545709 RepID=A0AAF0AZW5_9SCHI|nr:Schizosaccharomyces specific protein [Schizosaccharomyces osmophilus]WBW75393.1 Schizosaccharomyces specific protein [Schizosaccharomyces osmophilus]